MPGSVHKVPSARASVADPQLTRPDWTKGVPRDPRLLWLDKNENSDPELARLTARLVAEIAPNVRAQYPECTPLYRKLAALLGVEADHLLFAAGSDGVIRSVFEAFIDPGDTVVHTVPTFAMYAVYCKMFGARPATLEYQPAASGPFLAVDAVLELIGRVRPRMVCLPNPDSPTGSVFAPADLRRIIATSGDVGALVLIDEAYYPFYDHTVVPLVDEFPHLVVARTFAKAWGLADLRIGYGVACPELAFLLHKVRPMYEVNTIAVAVMERMLDFYKDVLASVKRLNEGRDGFLAAMEELGLRTFHAQGNFLHVAFGTRAPAVHAALKDLVLYREDFKEPCLKGFSRFSATTPERFQPIIERIRQVVTGVK